MLHFSMHTRFINRGGEISLKKSSKIVTTSTLAEKRNEWIAPELRKIVRGAVNLPVKIKHEHYNVALVQRVILWRRVAWLSSVASQRMSLIARYCLMWKQVQCYIEVGEPIQLTS